MKKWAERADYEGILAITDSKKKTKNPNDYISNGNASKAISFDPHAMRTKIEEEEQRQEMER